MIPILNSPKDKEQSFDHNVRHIPFPSPIRSERYHLRCAWNFVEQSGEHFHKVTLLPEPFIVSEHLENEQKK